MLSTSDDAGFNSLNRKSNFIENFKMPQNVLAIEQLLKLEVNLRGVLLGYGVGYGWWIFSRISASNIRKEFKSLKNT